MNELKDAVQRLHQEAHQELHNLEMSADLDPDRHSHVMGRVEALMEVVELVENHLE